MLSRPHRVLLTGGSGFVGRAVQERWSNLVLWPRRADLTREESVLSEVRRLLGEEPFDAVLHLAAQANPSDSVRDPILTWKVNLMGTVHLLEALASHGWRGRFLFVSTGAVYGGATGEIDESTPISLTSPYAASKCAAESAALEWGRRSEAEVVVVRPFNHSGPGQAAEYFLPNMACQIAELPNGGGAIEVGNLDVYRDFLHVDDVIDAYLALLEQGRPGEVYNLASGDSVSLRVLLTRMAELSGRRVSYRVSSERYREAGGEPVRVSPRKIQADTGWSPHRGLDQLLQDVMKEWMEKVWREQH